jgi:two-component system chemotaxis response regulator CheB
MTSAFAAAMPPRGEPTVRVMVVDDAVVVRGLISRWLSEAGGIEVVASHRNGRAAVEDMERADPDVVILDIEMPEMDGMAALPEILKKKRNVIVIMASTLTRRNAEISLKCLSLGATDYVPKPESNAAVTTSPEFRREIVDKVKALSRRALSLRAGSTGHRAEPLTRAEAATRTHSPTTGFKAATPVASSGGGYLACERAAQSGGDFKLRPFPNTVPRVLVIGSSTGGPQALNTVIAGISKMIDRVPVLIVQHMPATFTTILAEHLGRASGKPCAEAVDGEAIRPGRIYVAPGGRHMLIKRGDGHGVIALDDGPMVNFCKPAVDPMFASAAAVFGAAAFGLVLTGMGADGANGARELVAAGGGVIAQDEATSVVWGMPGATAQGGHCCAVLPLNDIAPKLVRFFAGDRT